MQLFLIDTNLNVRKTQQTVSVKCSVHFSCVRKMNRNKGQEIRMMRLLILAETRCNLGNAMHTSNQSVTLSMQS